MNGQLAYKYLPTDRIDVLKDSRIRFTQPNALNDPFECLPCLVQYKEQHITSLQSKATGKWGTVLADGTAPLREDMVNVLLHNLPDIIGKFSALLCVSQIPDNLLMWSHYAGNHTGFVIGFDADNQFFAPGRLSTEGLRPVVYSRDRYILPPFGFSGLPDAEMKKANEQFFFTKSIDWEYEREMRVLAMSNRADKTLENNDRPPIHLFNFPTDLVRSVILGFRMPLNIKEEIAGLIDEKYPKAAIWESAINAENYALDLIPYPRFSREQKRLSIVRDIFPYQVIFKDKAKSQ